VKPQDIQIPATISDKEKELVWEFIQMVTENDFQKLYMEKVGSPSPSKKIGLLTQAAHL
jgi:multiple sugar transport system substrate-binding protein